MAPSPVANESVCDHTPGPGHRGPPTPAGRPPIVGEQEANRLPASIASADETSAVPPRHHRGVAHNRSSGSSHDVLVRTRGPRITKSGAPSPWRDSPPRGRGGSRRTSVFRHLLATVERAIRFPSDDEVSVMVMVSGRRGMMMSRACFSEATRAARRACHASPRGASPVAALLRFRRQTSVLRYAHQRFSAVQPYTLSPARWAIRSPGPLQLELVDVRVHPSGTRYRMGSPTRTRRRMSVDEMARAGICITETRPFPIARSPRTSPGRTRRVAAIKGLADLLGVLHCRSQHASEPGRSTGRHPAVFLSHAASVSTV